MALDKSEYIFLMSDYEKSTFAFNSYLTTYNVVVIYMHPTG